MNRSILRTSSSGKSHGYRPAIESLESRHLLSVTLPSVMLPNVMLPMPTSAGSGTTVNAVRGVAVTFNAQATTPFSGIVAQLDGYTGSIAKLNATINWGDGSPASKGTFTAAPSSALGPVLTISGQHTFASAGTFTVEVIVSQVSGTVASAPSNVSMIVADIKSTAVVSAKPIGVTIAAKTNTPFSGLVGQLAGFTGNVSSLTASISWGDGSAVSKGTFAPTTTSANLLSILGQHTYTKAGTFAVSITVTEQTGPAGSTSPIILVANIASTAVVTPATGGVTLKEFAGVPFTADVGSFTYPNTIAKPVTNTNSGAVITPALSATIDWGDGSTSVGKIVAPSTATTLYQVDGTHVYMKTGTYKVHVLVTARTILPPTPTLSTVPPPPSPAVVIADFYSEIDVVPPTTAA